MPDGRRRQVQKYEMITHEFEPVFDKHSRILILGTFPSVKSRENGFFYGHPQNRFWKVLTALTREPVPVTIDEKKAFLLKTGIAVWDVIAKCEIEGSSDSSIRNVVPADLNRILEHAPIETIFANGGKAYELYRKYSYPVLQREIIRLPSTSPANASFQMERLIRAWEPVKKALDR